MVQHTASRHAARRHGFFYACLLAVALTGLGGCASKSAPAAGSGGRTDIITESDEPEARKRARIRLELAVGYFEQGQTTVALDELKQALLADPNSAPAYNLRGLIYMKLNDPRVAEESFRKAVALDPQDGNVVHNLGWMLCQQGRYPESVQVFGQALTNPQYGDKAKTWMTQGICQIRAGQRAEAEASLVKAYELDAGNPVTGFNLANLLFQRGEFVRAQFYARRINNSELANAETLWLGIKVERRLNNRDAMQQLSDQLRKRFPKSREAGLLERSAFDD
jgi:type IV pilus assembly protein PilF